MMVRMMIKRKPAVRSMFGCVCISDGCAFPPVIHIYVVLFMFMSMIQKAQKNNVERLGVGCASTLVAAGENDA